MSTDIIFPGHLCFDRQLAASQPGLQFVLAGETKLYTRNKPGQKCASQRTGGSTCSAREVTQWASFSYKPDLAYVHLKGSLPLELNSAEKVLVLETFG